MHPLESRHGAPSQPAAGPVARAAGDPPAGPVLGAAGVASGEPGLTSTDRRQEARRRQPNVAGGRPFIHQVKVSESEEAVLIRLSEAAGLSVARLLVESAMASDGPMRADQSRELLTSLFGLQRLLGSMAWNVNQVATAVNSTGELPPQAAAVFDAALRVTQRVDALIEELPTVSAVRATEHTRRRRRVAAVFGEEAAARVARDTEQTPVQDATQVPVQTAEQAAEQAADGGASGGERR